MTEAEVFRLWKSIAGDEAAAPWDEDRVFGFFQGFRPHGDGLDSALLPLPGGAEVLERLLRVYAATAEGQREGTVDMYFVVRAPVPSSLTELDELARRQARLWAEMAAEIGEDDLVRELEPRSVEMLERTPQHPLLDTPDIGLHDLETDWHDSLDSAFPAAHALREAFYSIACDYRIARHLTWPWYSSSTAVEEPFAPYFELWRRGVEIHVPEPGRIVLARRDPGADHRKH